ncbi:kinesin motor catalytic domain protein (macronuclear) [Tetrahymena thermophila SB210]|uniref:Kinesin-like protein n=1 Tax=Tetrahymena thermophila (strain SB210) TaxID=312017 RepID=Q231H3_TETTS|nr:kinesin motor catalytic domain protein [Tetrahymena thermophila SB210]EAR91066.1 kinesin motor catalytic domain protein [Tetrahymena thermophila SB210]|eukprot:XP_001011311.1 kinesin motor catalytic domain protein [Tetrahymena thermophila SB210]
MLRKQINNILQNQQIARTEYDESPQNVQIQQLDSFDSQNSGRLEYDSERYQQVDNVVDQGNQNNNKKKQTKKSSLLQNMEKMEQKRQERREKMNQMKQQKLEKEQMNKESNRNVDIDFEMLIEQERLNFSLQHVPISNNRLSVIVRKRPLFSKEEEEGELDSISCSNPIIRVHEPKYKVDGITKYVENQDFQFDNAFSEKESTEDVYKYSLQPLIKCIFEHGVVTCFAYGQTGSGKTFTMRGLQQHYINDIFSIIQKNHQFQLIMSYFEIYGGKCFDLLNERNQLNILEDKNNNVQIQNLIEKPVRDQLEMIEIIEQAAIIRTTHATEANEESSRSHAICQIVVKDTNGSTRGKLIMVDLAGSERAQDCQSNSKQRRVEGANINQSLLALKECIRAMDSGAQHVPFRGSKLTLVLRDSFLSKQSNSHIIMFACISPGSSSSDHTVNTLRYADRLKESNGIKQDVIKIIEEQSKAKKKKQNYQSSQQQMASAPQAAAQKKKEKEKEENDSNKKNQNAPPVKNLKGENKNKEERQYDHTQYLMNNAKNKENMQSVDNIPSIGYQDKPSQQEKKLNAQQAKSSQIQKIPPIQQSVQQIEQASTQNSTQQVVSSTSVSSSASALAQLHREKRDERPQTQQKRQSSIGKKNANQTDTSNQNLNNLLQQKILNTDASLATNHNHDHLSGVDQNKALSLKQLKQISQSNPVTTQNNQGQQIRINSAHPSNNNNSQNNNTRDDNNNSFNQLPKKGHNNQQQKKTQQNMDNISTINNKNNRDSSANHNSRHNSSSNNNNNQINNNNFNQNLNDKSLNDHILQKNKEVQENIEKAQQHQIEQKTKDLILQQIKEKQEDMFSSHMSAIKEDANLLSLESGLLTDCQKDGFMDCDIDSYVKKFESIVSKKLLMYNLLQQKMDTLKKMRNEYNNKYSLNQINNNHHEKNQQQQQAKQIEDPNKKRQSFLLKKKIEN